VVDDGVDDDDDGSVVFAVAASGDGGIDCVDDTAVEDDEDDSTVVVVDGVGSIIVVAALVTMVNAVKVTAVDSCVLYGVVRHGYAAHAQLKLTVDVVRGWVVVVEIEVVVEVVVGSVGRTVIFVDVESAAGVIPTVTFVVVVVVVVVINRNDVVVGVFTVGHTCVNGLQRLQLALTQHASFVPGSQKPKTFRQNDLNAEALALPNNKIQNPKTI
jgi:hypothetical protein